MLIRRNALVKYFIAFLFGASLYAEKLIYLIQTMYWNDLKCVKNDKTCTKILFIADPQIQGDLAAPVPFNYLFSWDSDRYLSITFSLVSNYFEPEVMVFLGDLMDEGSMSTMKQYYHYVKRLSDIYDVHYPVVQVWLPGDNDIGGENERIDWEKLQMFDSVFDQPGIIRFRNVSFYKVNAITHTLPTLPPESGAGLRVVVSHYPLLTRQAFAHKVQKTINPHIYFCAHDHESKYVKQTRGMERAYVRPEPFYDNQVLEIGFDGEELFEVYVPTCSYRMGTSSIGFGAAVLDRNSSRLRYTVLWSPPRFPSLWLYGAALLAAALWLGARAARRLGSLLGAGLGSLLGAGLGSLRGSPLGARGRRPPWRPGSFHIKA